MRSRLIFPLVFVSLLGLGLLLRSLLIPVEPAGAAPAVLASPLNASCELVTRTQCSLHVDPFTIQIADYIALEEFQIKASNHLLYDFTTDQSNPPLGDYTPSAVKLDFAATCGHTYFVDILARDSSETDFTVAGRAMNVTCPQATYNILLPVVIRQAHP